MTPERALCGADRTHNIPVHVTGTLPTRCALCAAHVARTSHPAPPASPWVIRAHLARGPRP